MKTRFPKVFISHSHADRNFATKLQKILNKYSAYTYLDQDRIQAGDVLPDRIADGIERCDTFLLMWSQNAAKSAWVEREWDMAYELRKKIIPYRLDTTRLPLALENFVFVDRQDEQHSHAHLLKAVFGEDVKPPPSELFRVNGVPNSAQISVRQLMI